MHSVCWYTFEIHGLKTDVSLHLHFTFKLLFENIKLKITSTAMNYIWHIYCICMYFQHWTLKDSLEPKELISLCQC